MYGVSKINIEPSLMMISVQDVEFKGNSLARYLQIFADTGVVVDMISQSAPHGTNIDFSFTASASDLTLVMKAISAASEEDLLAAPGMTRPAAEAVYGYFHPAESAPE